MEPFHTIDAVAFPLPVANVDTDQIVPARFLRKPRSEGFGGYLFHDLRFAPDGSPRDFALDSAAYKDARIIVADRNFGCGSSREHAVWALYDYGFRVAIAPSFGDIFANNGFQNGFLPLVAPEERCAELRRQLHEKPSGRVRVDLENQTVTEPSGATFGFEIDPFRKRCLLSGLDELGFTLTLEDAIRTFEEVHLAKLNWL